MRMEIYEYNELSDDEKEELEEMFDTLFDDECDESDE